MSSRQEPAGKGMITALAVIFALVFGCLGFGVAPDYPWIAFVFAVFMGVLAFIGFSWQESRKRDEQPYVPAQVKPSPTAPRPIETFIGNNGAIDLFDYKIVIRRQGFSSVVLHGMDGNKEIWLDAITAIQFKLPGKYTNGYMQFVLQGSHESKGGLFDATSDENSVMFSDNASQSASQMKDLIEEKMLSRRPGANFVAPPEPRASTSVADELAKLADLKDRGAISQDQFEALRDRLLSNQN